MCQICSKKFWCKLELAKYLAVEHKFHRIQCEDSEKQYKTTGGLIYYREKIHGMVHSL